MAALANHLDTAKACSKSITILLSATHWIAHAPSELTSKTPDTHWTERLMQVNKHRDALSNSYLCVKHIAESDTQLVEDSSCRLATVMHDLDDAVRLQDLPQATDNSLSCLWIDSHQVKDEADRSSIHLHHIILYMGPGI
jgi:hypothetical protein